MIRRALRSFLAATSAFWFGALSFTSACRAAEAAPLQVVSDYDGGEVYWARDGKKQPIRGMREAWAFNRVMRWLGEADGTGGPILCYSGQSPVLLTGAKQVSRWFTGPANDLADVGDDFTRFVKRDAKTDLDQVSLPPFQFHVEQNPAAELEVQEATHPWQFVVVVKGRSGPPLYASPWQEGPQKLTVELRKLYREKGYDNHYAELHFALFIRTKEPKDAATVVFRLGLPCRMAIVPSLPVIRTADRAKTEGVPISALVLDEAARPFGASAVAVTATVGGQTVKLGETKGGVWRETVKGLPVGEHKVTLTAIRREGRSESVSSDLLVRITDGEFLGYDPALKLLTRAGKPIGPITGSYRGAPMFKGIGTPEESLVQGQKEWDAVKGARHEGQYFNHGGPGYGFHFWESLTGKELDADYAYLAKCGWTVVHLCQGWWYWERLDAGGRIAPHGAEQLVLEATAAARHGVKLHLALSHYPLGKQSKPYTQYLEAGYKREDYGRADSKFYEMFKGYLADFAALFRDETALSSYTAAGEGDVDCGKTFVNEVAAFMQARDPKHLFLCEPHLNPKPYPSDMNYYVRDGWKPLLGGMRTYMIDRMPPEHIAVQYKLAAMGHVFLGEGVFWGFMNGPHETARYRERVRQGIYTGLAYRLPILLTWEERVVEDERAVFDEVRRSIDWSKPFQRPRLVLRVGSDLGVLARYEKTLAKMPLEYAFILKDDPVPPGALYVLDTQAPFVEPAFESAGGKIPDALKADMPLQLPVGFAASYSWSEDRRTLLAYVRDTGDVERAAGQELSLGLGNFPAGKLRARLYDLEAKKVIAEGEFEKEHTLKVPAGTRDLFLVVGR